MFALYMVLILVMTSMQLNQAMNAVLSLAVVCVTSSTIDSIAVALHELANKRPGTLVALFICVFWGVFAGIGVLGLWSKAGVYRVVFAAFIVVFVIAAI